MDFLRHCQGNSGALSAPGETDGWNKPQSQNIRRDARVAGEVKTALEHVIGAEIIPRLALAHRRVDAEGRLVERVPRTIDVEGFVDLLRSSGYHSVLTYVRDLGDSGISSDTILLDLFAPAARRLGELWKEDLCDFVEVTRALSVLQQLVRERSTGVGLEQLGWTEQKRILLAPAPGEQHTLGISIVEKFFLAGGWDVWGGAAGLAFDLTSLVRREWFGVVGFSLGSEKNLDGLVVLIREIRRSSRNTHLGVIVGGPAFLERPDLAILIGADATAVDALSAVPVAQKLLELGSAAL